MPTNIAQSVTTPGIFILGGGLQPSGSVPRGVQERRPGRGSRNEVPSEAEAVCRHRLQILTAETIKMLKLSHNPPPDS